MSEELPPYLSDEFVADKLRAEKYGRLLYEADKLCPGVPYKTLRQRLKEMTPDPRKYAHRKIGKNYPGPTLIAGGIQLPLTITI